MAEENWITTTVSHVGTFIFGAGGLGLLWFNHIVKRKEREREEKSKVRETVLKLLPELRIAENSYMCFLRQSLHYHELGGDPSIIDSPKPSKQLIDLIEASPLHLLDSPFQVRLTGHKAIMQVLADELSERQSTLLHGYDHPESIEEKAKDFMEKRLADILVDLYLLRRDLTVRYLDKGNWSEDDQKVGRDLKKLRVEAYSVILLSDRLRKLKEWYYLKRFRLGLRVRRWFRT